MNALCLELQQWGLRLGERAVDTIFLGGGTPTVLDEGALARIFETIHASFHLAPNCEITSEANPGTVDRQKFAALRALGINRLSMGVQSFQPEELSFLGRIHDVKDVYCAFDAARVAGFENINLDFIFGLPHQSIAHWRATLDRAIDLEPEHLSLYSLIVEPDTPLHHWVEIGRVDAPDDDQAGLLYEIALEHMGAAGYVQYEVSNWARDRARGTGHSGRGWARERAPMPAFACRHNLIYWRNQEYLGVGPGAHSYLSIDAAAWAEAEENAIGIRWSNRKPVPGYIKRMAAVESVEEQREIIHTETSMGETMMLGLRLLEEGVPLARFRNQYGVELTDVYAEEIARFVNMDLLILDDVRARLTRRGLMLGNQVFAAFLR